MWALGTLRDSRSLSDSVFPFVAQNMLCTSLTWNSLMAAVPATCSHQPKTHRRTPELLLGSWRYESSVHPKCLVATSRIVPAPRLEKKSRRNGAMMQQTWVDASSPKGTVHLLTVPTPPLGGAASTESRNNESYHEASQPHSNVKHVVFQATGIWRTKSYRHIGLFQLPECGMPKKNINYTCRRSKTKPGKIGK